MIHFSDWTLYLVSDRSLCVQRSLIETIEAAIQGGVTAVQLREKGISTREYVEIGRHVFKFLRSYDIPLIINDRVDVALAIGAHGIHLGQSDLHFDDARKIMGPNALIGISVETIEQVHEADRWDVDYLAVSPLFSTQTKKDISSPWGLNGLKQARLVSKHQLVAIGGIHLNNVRSVLETGVDGVAVVSAICSSSSPGEEALKFKQVIGEVNRAARK